jgi:tRNA(Arg) A34 adenosine deaminase TadA
MSDYIERNIEILRKAAIDIVNPVRSYRVSASLVYKRRIVSFGINRYKTSPIQNRFKKNENAIYLHAEVACVKNALRHLDVEDFKKCDMFVVRVKRLVYEGEFVYAMAKPCEGCSRCIAEFGIRNVYYTVEDPNETWRKM